MYHLPCGRGHDRHRNADSRSNGDAHCDAYCDAYACSRLFRDAGLEWSARFSGCYTNCDADAPGDAYASRGVRTIC